MTSPIEERDGAGATNGADPSSRTLLAAERTWLAWWRSGIAAATAAVAVGGLVPQLVEGSRWPYELLGGGYSLLALGVFTLAALRQRRVEDTLRRGRHPAIDVSWILGMTVAGGVLALATLVVVVVQP